MTMSLRRPGARGRGGFWLSVNESGGDRHLLGLLWAFFAAVAADAAGKTCSTGPPSPSISTAPSLLQFGARVSDTFPPDADLQFGARLRSGASPPYADYCRAANRDFHANVGRRDRSFGALCSLNKEQYAADLNKFVENRPSHRVEGTLNVSALIQTLRADGHEVSRSNALAALERISKVEAQDVLAFKETWTDHDTEILRHLDSRERAWTDDETLTTEGVRARLPSLQDLEALVSRAGSGHGLAVVGAGRSLAGKRLGQDIDRHAQVVRFNEFAVGSNVDTGNHTTLQVLNRWVPGRPNITLFDLELTNVADPLCWRLNRRGKFARQGMMFLVRPSARCAMKNDVDAFTRGFMFYWFVGSLFEKVDLYGFAASSGRFHYRAGDPQVSEPFLPFEHRVYEVVRALQTEKRVLALLAEQTRKQHRLEMHP